MNQPRHIILHAAVALSLALTACHRKQGPPAAESPAQAVRVLRVEARPRAATEDVVGTVSARTRATIEAKITSRVEQLLVAPGQRVRKGEELAKLDAREIQARLDQALALRGQAVREQARFAGLLEKKAVTQQEFDAVDTRARVSASAVTEAQTMLGYAQVTAPFDGVVTRKIADVGDLLTPGKALLEMEGASGFRIEADVPEALVAKLSLGMKLPVRVDAADGAMEGVVSEIAPSADSGSRTFLVKVDLPEAKALRAGQFARVGVPVAEKMTLRVPAAVVSQRGQLELLFVVHDSKAALRIVKTGKRVGDEVEIISGLEAGEDVVANGAEHLTDGQPVTIAK
jgi:RND family efflux transporter MFP subunit